jgi:hypothetical protein
MFQNPLLFPVERRNSQFRNVSIDVDYLFLDNTFANPEYDFPSREEAFKGLVEVVKSHETYRIYLFSYSLGKEEVFISLAKQFQTLVHYDF